MGVTPPWPTEANSGVRGPRPCTTEGARGVRQTDKPVAWKQGSTHNILHGSVESAIPENPQVGPNISGLSAIQADL